MHHAACHMSEIRFKCSAIEIRLYPYTYERLPRILISMQSRGMPPAALYTAHVMSGLGLLSRFASFSTYKMHFVPTLGVGMACRWDGHTKNRTFMSTHSPACQRGVKRSFIRICLKLEPSYHTWCRKITSNLSR